MRNVGKNKCVISKEQAEHIWELWTYNHGDLNQHLIAQYQNERFMYEQTRWLPDLKEAQKNIPVHICWGDQDDVNCAPTASVLQEEFCPKAKLTWIHGGGHFIEQEKPKEVAYECLQWWKSLKSKKGGKK